MYYTPSSIYIIHITVIFGFFDIRTIFISTFVIVNIHFNKYKTRTTVQYYTSLHEKLKILYSVVQHIV
jgi:hypothetical protein